MQSINYEADGERLLRARDAASRLGVKLDTLYAYVSRGLLRSVPVPGSRERHYRADDVERFRITRGVERGRDALVPLIDSAISLIADGRFFYRGCDALRLAENATLEEIADLLWNAGASAPTGVTRAASPTCEGELVRGRGGEAPKEYGPGIAVRIGPRGMIERAQARLALLATEDLAALDLTRAGIIRTGRAILAELAATIADGANPDIGNGPAHCRLADRWGLDPAGADLIRRVLVLLAEHELNASAFVARCVASTGATPYAVVMAALAALSGRRHGGASARAEALFAEIGFDAIGRNAEPMAVMAARLARGDDLPGIGHPLYPDGDPRARAIIEAVAAARPDTASRVAAAAHAAKQLTGQHPNVDFALGAAVTALGLPGGSALALFVVGRTVGWIAHAIEQYESGILIRPRARYTGPRPSRPGLATV
ncbi:MAG: citrate/2-methylcitrate synthase [Alphaproteobacteria bacterium]